MTFARHPDSVSHGLALLRVGRSSLRVMSEECTPKYGLTRSTSKPVKLACWDLSRAIKTLSAHHDAEEPFFAETLAGFDEGVSQAPEPTADWLRRERERLDGIAAGLREARAALRDELQAMWPAIEDVVQEEATLRPSGSILLAEEPDTMPQAPVPIVRDLQPIQWLRILVEAVTWTREISYGAASVALGPCYLLSKVIEYPKPQASGLRDIAGEAHDHIRHFLAERNA